MRVHLIDGTYELFRHFFAIPSRQNESGEEIAAVRGVVFSLLDLLRGYNDGDRATHMAVATDHVVESFRNQLWEGYKTGEGIDPTLFAQFPILEESLEAVGIPVWRMVEHEADDGLAAGAAMAAQDDRVEEVLICTPDKDLAQCVGGKVIQFDRRKRLRMDRAGIREKFGVDPESIPDYLGLMGDSADGFPGLKGWGAKSSATLLAHYKHIEAIPDDPEQWAVKVRGAKGLASVLAQDRELAFLFRRIATVVREAPVSETVDELEWKGPGPGFADTMKRLAAPELQGRLNELQR